MTELAVITGGAGRLGMALARRLAGLADVVALVDNDRNRLDRAVCELRAERVSVLGTACDVREPDQVAAAVAEWSAAGSWPRILVNAAGIPGRDGERAPVERVTDADWQSTLDVNLTGAFLWCRAVVPVMRERGRGWIVNVASLAGRTASPTAALPYSAAKAGLIGLTRALAAELAPGNLLVNAVAPARIENPDWPGASRPAGAGVPLGRLATAEEVAEVIAFLASPANTYTTGATVDVNGGRFIA